MEITHVPLLDLKAQNGPLKAAVLNRIEQVYDSGQFIMGEWLEQFEKEVAAYLEVKHAIGVSSGTDALLLSLMALGVGAGDAVITSTFSFFATAGVISRLGARPYFADIDPETYNINARSAEAAIHRAQSDGARPKALIPVHLFGQSADMDKLMEIAASYGLAVVEDAAQAIGAQYPIDGCVKNVGTIGLCGCYSFFPSKNLGCLGDGGLTVTNDDNFAERLRLLRTHGAKAKYYHSDIGGNFRMDALQAAVLSEKLPHLDNWHKQRRRNAERYRRMLAATDLVSTGKVTPPAEKYPALPRGHIYNQFVLRVKERDSLRQFLNSRKIGNEIYYPLPFHMQQCFRNLGYREGDFPVAEAAAREVLAVPIYAELTEEQQQYVIDAIAAFYAGRN